ncbi:MAG TPA: NUDIX hydrolase [Candidatus Paceibacterota bacterium]|nr:NUDIX hydrolase [Candidatus Paceibacterota bacterium]
MDRFAYDSSRSRRAARTQLRSLAAHLLPRAAHDRVRQVAVLLVEKDDRVLLGFRDGSWSFPGGERAGDEPLDRTLRRAIMNGPAFGICWTLRPIHAGIFEAPPLGETFRFHAFACQHWQLIGMPSPGAKESAEEFAWVDRPLELNLTEQTRAVLALQERWRTERA